VLCDTPNKITGWRRHSAYVLRVGTTGLIFAAIAIAWLAYLVPHFSRRRDDETVDVGDPAHRFSDSMRILRRGTAPLLDQDLQVMDSFEVSTPMTRRAAISDLQRLVTVAARRRRRVLSFLLLALTVVLGLYVAGFLLWWAALIPGGLLLVFLIVAPLSVRAMRRSLDARYQDIRAGSDESTVFLSRRDVHQAHPQSKSTPVEPAAKPGVLWDPVPITMPTYVSKPLAPRTVRTIDLSGPEITASARHAVPVIADAPQTPVEATPGDRGDEMPETAAG
jgi:hypothetical protein